MFTAVVATISTQFAFGFVDAAGCLYSVWRDRMSGNKSCRCEHCFCTMQDRLA
jgi:hypothetical protein